MSEVQTSIMPLNSGLDLSTAKMLVEPGSLVDCLNYELVDQLGYRRIDGFAPYDGNTTSSDVVSMRVYTGLIFPYLGATVSFYNTPFEDADGNIIGFMLSFEANGIDNNVIVKYISFTGDSAPAGVIPSEGQSWDSEDLHPDEGMSEESAWLTQEQFQYMQDYFISTVTDLPATAVGLHWWRDALYAVVPVYSQPYTASDDNQPVSAVLNDLVFQGANSMTLLSKIVLVEADVSTPESGILLLSGLTSWASSGTITGALTVAAGTVEADGNLVYGPASDYCTLWKAVRPATYNEDQTLTTPGWVELPYTYTTIIELDGIQDEFSALRRGSTEADSTYYFGDGTGVVKAVLIDYFLLDGAWDTGTAQVVMQFGLPTLQSGTHELDITEADDLFSDAAATLKLADVTERMALIYLPGVPGLKANSSRYEFISANFYATEDYDAFYGVNGAGRAFVYGGIGEGLSYIYTQADADKDKPRHLENHALHLALGYKAGSVLISVVGQPTNFSGLLGASEWGVGDRVTGLMALAGTTLGIFCESSIWSLVGNTLDNFNQQVIVPKTGCIEYTLVNCGEPVFCNNNGITTLSTSASYGDFLGTKLSAKVSAWLLPRLRRNYPNTMNNGGVNCAIPIREKNQYRLFFNDGNILTMTLREEGGPGFSWQKYYLYVEDGVYVEDAAMIPLAYTSQVDWQGKERIFASHYNENSPIAELAVFVLENGDSFRGTYIPHDFTINWYFTDNPAQYNTLKSVRMHGQSRGLARLKVQSSGIQNDYFFGGAEFTTTLVPINLPRTSPGITDDFHPVTNRAEIAARGLAVQLKFSGSNTDLDVIEPSHLAQVLILASLPYGAADL